MKEGLSDVREEPPKNITGSGEVLPASTNTCTARPHLCAGTPVARTGHKARGARVTGLSVTRHAGVADDATAILPAQPKANALKRWLTECVHCCVYTQTHLQMVCHCGCQPKRREWLLVPCTVQTSSAPTCTVWPPPS